MHTDDATETQTTHGAGIFDELADGIAAYRRTWSRFDGLTVSAQCGRDPAVRQRGIFDAGECQATLTREDGRRYVIQDLGTLRVEGSGLGDVGGPTK